ncbi:NnrS family protein, partial [Mycobacterium tuberculosis]|nr:NnrS family protein [Mycobacterium tuberculosis]
MRVYRYAFILAAVAALKPVLPPVTADIAGHHLELIFGFLPLQLFGFLSAALPRWIGRPLLPAPLAVVLLVLHALALFWS